MHTNAVEEGQGVGPYTFQDWGQVTFLDQFYRSSNTSAVSTARFYSQCGGGYQNSSCCVAVVVNVTLMSVSVVYF